MTKALPFTEASLARAIKGAKRAGMHVVGVKADGTIIVGDAPTQAPGTAEETPPKRLEDYFNGNQSAAARS